MGSLGNGRCGPNPSHEPFGSRFWQFGAFHPAIEIAVWNPWERLFEAKSWPGALSTLNLVFWMAPGRLLTFSSGIIRKQPFGVKSWPGALWSQIVAIWHLSAGYGNCLVE